MTEDHTGQAPEAPAVRARSILHRPAVLVTLAVLILVIVVAVILHMTSGGDGFSLIDEGSGDLSSLAIFLLVFGDAICPILPGETTLNTASTLAAQDVLDLGIVMLAGAAGAVIGDSTLYWIARVGGKRFQPRLDKPMHSEQVVAALDFIGSRAPLLLVVGRYCPGLRFVINATFGVSAYPYPTFLLWSAIGGIIWSVYTCGLAYLVGTALADFPLASVIISGVITTTALGVLFLIVRRSRREEAASAAMPVS